MQIRKFNIRVYGIVIHKGKVLVIDEFRYDTLMTKFPGGGLEFGEGTTDCLRREFREELDQEIVILQHIYTTDYFQPTELLVEPQQLISIYYRVELMDYNKLITSEKPFDFRVKINGVQSFRWLDLKTIKAEDLSFPIDKLVAERIKAFI